VQVIFRDIFGKGKSSAITSSNNEIVLKMVQMHILEFEDVLFHLNSAVMMPENPQGASSTQGGGGDTEQLAVTGIKALALVFRQFEFDPNKRAVIAGHTDTSGTDEFNFKLSLERAKGIFYLLNGEKEEWAKLAYGRHKVEDYQQIMKHYEKLLFCGCDPGDLDDIWGENTRVATKKFFERVCSDQASYLLSRVESDSKKRWAVKAWEVVYDLYSRDIAEVLEISEGELNVRRQTDLKFVNDNKPLVGCGESFPIDSKEKNNYRSQKNRRVEILFFDKEEIPELNCPPQIKRSHSKEECPLWKKFYFVPVYIDPTDLQSVVYHIQFFYYDKIKRKQLPVPRGLLIRVLESNHKMIPSEAVYKNGVYYVKVKFKEKINNPSRNEFYFEFRTVNQWIYTKDDETDSEIVIKTAAEINDLNFTDRQQYYDLPGKWSSRNYWTRYDGDFMKGERFEEVLKTIQKIKPFGNAITQSDKPLVFCLDDFVLTDSNFIPIGQPAGSYDAAILDDTFAVYRPDSTNHKRYYTKGGITVSPEFQYVRIPAAETILRGVIIQHKAAGVSFKYKLFVIFDDRVPHHHELSGYRAAVFEHRERCVLVKRFQQRHQRDYHNIGKFDSYLLRDLFLNDDGERVSYIFQYYRWHFKGAEPPHIGPRWIDTAITNITDEWNNTYDNQLVSLVGTIDDVKYRIYVRFYIEHVPEVDRETLVNVNPSGSGRSNMGRDEGNIKVDEHERSVTTSSFTGAHEYGHAASLDDDYIETANYCSYLQIGFVDFKPGGPFNLDKYAMMRSNEDLRSRYYWHLAVWMQKEFIKDKKPEFTVIRKNVKDFKLPENRFDQFDPRDFSKDAVHYINYPYKFLRNAKNAKSTQAYKGKFHLYLYPLGDDEYSNGGLYGADKFTALLVVVVNIFIESWSGNPDFMTIYNRLRTIQTDIDSKFRINNGIRIKGHKPFDNTFVQIAPRYLVNHYASDYSSIFPSVTNADFTAARNFALNKPEGSKHLVVKIVTGNTVMNSTKDPPELIIKNTNTELNKFWKYFSHTLGLPYGATLNMDNFGVKDFIQGGVVENI
jgi:hypothetical protein